MSAYIIRNQITDIEKLKLFKCEGYEYNEELSSEYNLVFTRENGWEERIFEQLGI